jgi:hypothetical protein
MEELHFEREIGYSVQEGEFRRQPHVIVGFKKINNSHSVDVASLGSIPHY